MFNTTQRGGFGLPSVGLPRPPFVPGIRQMDPNSQLPGDDQELPPLSAQTPMSYAPAYTPESEQASGIVAGDQPGLPKPPPPARSNNPFGKDNLGQTLLGIGSAFLSSPDFFSGLGAAGQAVSSRKDDLVAKNKPNVSYGGPGGQFEIVTNPDGSRSIREVPEFAKYNSRVLEAKSAPTQKELVDGRSRLMAAIMRLPPDQRANAYREVQMFPDRYGVDVKGMPQFYNDTYGNVMGGMGMTASQAASDEDRDRGFAYRQTNDARNFGQRERRLNKPPAARRAAPSKPPAGFILDQ